MEPVYGTVIIQVSVPRMMGTDSPREVLRTIFTQQCELKHAAEIVAEFHKQTNNRYKGVGPASFKPDTVYL